MPNRPIATEQVKPLDLGVLADHGAPLPILVQTDTAAILVFFLAAHDPSGNMLPSSSGSGATRRCSAG